METIINLPLVIQTGIFLLALLAFLLSGVMAIIRPIINNQVRMENRLDRMESEITDIKSEMTDIKSKLDQLLSVSTKK